MNIERTSQPHPFRPNAQRLHVLPDRKDRVFSSAQADLFERSSRHYLETFDQVGRTAASQGAMAGAALTGVAGLMCVGGALLLTAGDPVGMAVGAVLGVATAGVLGAIVFPACVSGMRQGEQDGFVSAHPAPYLEAGQDRWLTADGHLLHDFNGLTRGRLEPLESPELEGKETAPEPSRR